MVSALKYASLSLNRRIAQILASNKIFLGILKLKFVIFGIEKLSGKLSDSLFLD